MAFVQALFSQESAPNDSALTSSRGPLRTQSQAPLRPQQTSTPTSPASATGVNAAKPSEPRLYPPPPSTGRRGQSPFQPRPQPYLQQQPQQQEEQAEQALWMRACPTYSVGERRFRPSETWSAISPSMPPLATILGPAAGGGDSRSSTAHQHSPDDFDRANSAQFRSASMVSSSHRTGSAGRSPSFTSTCGATTVATSALGRARDDNPFIVCRGGSASHHPQQAASGGFASSGDGADDVGEESVDVLEDAWLKTRLAAIGSTSNPHSQRLFSQLAPQKFHKEREIIEAEILQHAAGEFAAAATRRSANNLLPPTPFSQTVPVLSGPLPSWQRRLEPALDLDGQSSDEDDEAVGDAPIYDEFLFRELHKARSETARTERRGEHYRLPLLQAENFLKIYERAPGQVRDPNQLALEYLAKSRPELAPALRRLAPYQLHLIDWTALFRGGTHHDVSVTAKKFPHAAAWVVSPFSEAPVATGAIGFVGNLSKREQETSFFTKMHASNDGRIRDAQMMEWMKKAPIRMTVKANEDDT